MPACTEDTGPITGPITNREWLFCRFMQYGCDWPGARLEAEFADIAKEVRDSHERFCRYRFISNL